MTTNKSCTLRKTQRPYFQELLKTTLDNSIPLKTDDITCSVEHFNYAAQQVQHRPIAIQKAISNTHRQSKKK